MNLSLKEQLEAVYGKPKSKKDKPLRRKPQDQRTEVLSEYDIRSLMGTNMQVLKRGKGGAFRR